MLPSTAAAVSLAATNEVHASLGLLAAEAARSAPDFARCVAIGFPGGLEELPTMPVDEAPPVPVDGETQLLSLRPGLWVITSKDRQRLTGCLLIRP